MKSGAIPVFHCSVMHVLSGCGPVAAEQPESPFPRLLCRCCYICLEKGAPRIKVALLGIEQLSQESQSRASGNDGCKWLGASPPEQAWESEVIAGALANLTEK